MAYNENEQTRGDHSLNLSLSDAEERRQRNEELRRTHPAFGHQEQGARFPGDNTSFSRTANDTQSQSGRFPGDVNDIRISQGNNTYGAGDTDSEGTGVTKTEAFRKALAAEHRERDAIAQAKHEAGLFHQGTLVTATKSATPEQRELMHQRTMRLSKAARDIAERRHETGRRRPVSANL